MNILFRCVQNIQINMLSHVFIIKGTVRIRHHVARRPVAENMGSQVRTVAHRLFLSDIPHLQKHHSKILHRVALDHYACIFPVSKTQFFIDIFIRQIHAPCKGRDPVDYQYFTVIPVVLTAGKSWTNGRKHFTLNPHLPDPFRIFIGQKQQRTHSVIHKADLHAFRRLFPEDLQHRLPHPSFGYDKILHKNKVFCLL